MKTKKSSIVLKLSLIFIALLIGCTIVFINYKSKINQNNLHFFYCADDGNAMPTCVSIASLLDNSGEEKINVHIVSFSDNKMSQQNISKIESLKNSIKDFNLDFTYFDKAKLNDFDTEIWNKAIMVKLYAAELFPDLKRIIWLDDDTIVLKSLKDLYNTEDLNNKYLAAVDVSEEYNKNAAKSCDYWITAGIGLYNLEEMRKNNVQESLLNSAKNYPIGGHASQECCGGTEEYALTYGIPKDKVYVLPYKYSVMASLFHKEAYSNINVSDCVMLHFAGSKPWKAADSIEKKFYDKWDYYFQKTEY